MDSPRSSLPADDVGPSQSLAACAAVSRSQLAHARTLVQSFRSHHPDGRFYLLVVDGLPDGVSAGVDCEVLGLQDVSESSVPILAETFDLERLRAAVKPTLMRIIFERFGEERAVLLDPDMWVMRPLMELREALSAGSIVLVPNSLRPLPHRNQRPSDRELMIHGAYSDALLGVKKSAQSNQFLEWWERHLLIGEGRITDEGPVFIPHGMVHPRKWLDLAPTLFSETVLLRDDTYNVSWWNLHHRLVTRGRDGFRANGRGITTFHFAGFDPLHSHRLTETSQTRHHVIPDSPLADLLDCYAGKVVRNGYVEVRDWPSPHRTFENGIFGHLLLRQLYAGVSDDARCEVAMATPHAFGGRLVAWATRFGPNDGELSPFLRFVYHLRPDLACAFPDVTGQDRHAFLEWARTHGAREVGFHPALAHLDAGGLAEPCSDVTPYQKALLLADVISPTAPSLPSEDGARTVSRYAPVTIAGLEPARPQCSIVIPVYGKASLTRQCLETLLTPPFEKATYEIIVVDDASPDETAALLRTYGDRIRVITHPVNQGFARTCNDGAVVAGGDYLVFLNNDTIPQPGWLDSLVSYIAVHPRVAAVGSKLLYPNGTVQHAGTVILQDRWPRHVYVGFPADHPAVNKSRRFQAVTAASMLIHRQRFEELGGFDSTFVNSYEDVDLCLRLNERGHEVHYCHESVLYHLESVTRAHRVDEDERNARTYFRRWGHRVEPDDVRYYIDDGLLRINRADGRPRLVISPYLATARSPAQESRSDRIIARRSSQLLELLKENVQLRVSVMEDELRHLLHGDAWEQRKNGTQPMQRSRTSYAGES